MMMISTYTLHPSTFTFNRVLGTVVLPQQLQLQFLFKPPPPSPTSGSDLGSGSSSAKPEDFLPHRPKPTSSSRLSISKPSLVVRTQSNVRLEKRRKPEPCCVVCQGSGRVDCHRCHGTGRTNCTDLIMLPSGEWPNWCKTCGGSGLGYCDRCLGTGEYRDIMGFRFMKRETDDSRDHIERKTTEKPDYLTAADMFLSQTSSEPGQQQVG